MVAAPTSPSASPIDDLVAALAQALSIEPAAVITALPAPVAEVDIVTAGESRWLRCGDPVLVLVGTHGGDVVVAEPEVEWQGHTPVLRVRAARTLQPAVPTEHGKGVLGAAVAAARDARLRRFRVCGECQQSNPPEWMVSHRLCQACAQRNDGVVF